MSMYQPDQLILTAGPSIADREIQYVTDAIRTGWNFHYRDYLEKFEAAFAKHVGVRYAVSTCSGTAALHLAALALGLGPGDEVIVPDQTFVACANAIRYTGATPVMADVQPDTWCLDPQSVRRCLTPRTRAIMPVYHYGTPPPMDELIAIAREQHLFVIEDACPAAGVLVNGRHAGSLGHVGCFSFQGAKIMVTGEGGMLVTDDAGLASRARFFGSHAKDPNRSFWHPEVGYMYRMSNPQAALGLAQLERLEEFVAAKRRIFGWYHDRLGGIDGLRMNAEPAGTHSNYWMSSIILDRAFNVTRDELMAKLHERKVDTRPFFYPITAMPMYRRAQNPVSYHLGANGMNLPSGVRLTEEQVDYVARQVREVLGV